MNIEHTLFKVKSVKMCVYLPTVLFFLLPSCILPQSPSSLTSVHSVLPTLNGACHPRRSRPPFWCLILWWNRGGDLEERAPGDFTFGCPICKWAELQCGSTPGSQAGWHALLLLLLSLLLQHYHKGCGSPWPLSGVYIEHWCNDIVVFVPVSSA